MLASCIATICKYHCIKATKYGVQTDAVRQNEASPCQARPSFAFIAQWEVIKPGNYFLLLDSAKDRWPMAWTRSLGWVR